MYYLDLHTHSAEIPHDSGHVAIRSFDLSEGEAFNAWPGLRSVGFHPWYLPGHWAESLPLLARLLGDNRTPLLGEAGLDALRGPAPDVQLAAFTAQARLADEMGKPVVVHCVRAFDALERLYRSKNFSSPWIIHGFNKGGDTAEKMSASGFFFSFGAALLRHNSPAADVFSRLPIDKVLLETDAAAASVTAVYERAAALRGLPIAVLADAIYANWQRLKLID